MSGTLPSDALKKFPVLYNGTWTAYEQAVFLDAIATDSDYQFKPYLQVAPDVDGIEWSWIFEATVGGIRSEQKQTARMGPVWHPSDIARILVDFATCSAWYLHVHQQIPNSL